MERVWRREAFTAYGYLTYNNTDLASDKSKTRNAKLCEGNGTKMDKYETMESRIKEK